METFGRYSQLMPFHRPHSLGQSVEWKLAKGGFCGFCYANLHRPHSLGQSVEWKPSIANATWLSVKGPHSLGQSVEWKRSFGGKPSRDTEMRPHSLGQSVEWKPCRSISARVSNFISGPTRWGNQLNGNNSCPSLLRSHQSLYGPTRWGNQLNGNFWRDDRTHQD